MLAKVLSSSKNRMVTFAKRGLYAPGTEPYVFINKHTKVICQGMTGKHVLFFPPFVND
jgi:hypothetical protein